MIYILQSNNEASHSLAVSDHIKVLNLLQINFLPFVFDKQKLEFIDYILLTSKNSIKSLYNNELLPFLIKKPALVIGQETKLAWLEAGGNILFCPQESCSGIEFATILKESLKDVIYKRQILYLCGKDKATDFTYLLKNYCEVVESVVYESIENPNILYAEADKTAYDSKNKQENTNKIASYNHNDSKHILFPNDSIFIFGSPKHYKTFIKYCQWNPTWLAISLGDTTFNSFSENIRKLNAKGNFKKALQVAQAMSNETPLQNESKEFEQIPTNN